jgi:hypothetical protein
VALIQTIEVKKENKLSSDEATLAPFKLIPSSKILVHHPQKRRTVHPGYAFEDTAFKPGFEIV